MDRQQLKSLIKQTLITMAQAPIPLGVSNRHLHLSAEDFARLFPGQQLQPSKPLSQPGHYAAEQTLMLAGPKGCLKRVRVLGPFRRQTQVEISASDARWLGIDTPLRLSGDLANTPGIKLVSDQAELTLASGLIIAKRHIHMSPADALIYGVKHGDDVSVAILNSPRALTFDQVSIRVDPQMRLEMHIDTDEANAAGMTLCDAMARIIAKGEAH